MLIVMKFGGSSLASAAHIRRAAELIADQRKNGDQVAVVVSAQGDTTDELITKAKEITETPPGRERDMLLSCGEQMSMALMAMQLEALGCPAVSFCGWQAGICTEARHGDARILKVEPHRVKQALEAGKVAVVAGFQGIDRHENITTLGRGGSDTTAVALAAFLQADKCMIYTDVDGVYDRDPRLYPEAVRFDTISYADMLALARQGAQVLHDRCVELATLLPGVRVLHGDATSQSLLESEGLARTDALVTLTGLDELNMVISLYGNSQGVPQIITKLGRMGSSGIVDDLPLGSLIYPKALCCNTIVRYVRAMQNQTEAAVSLHHIADGQVEALEFHVTETTKGCGIPLKNLKLKNNVLIAGISHGSVTEIPNGDSCFHKDDAVVVVTSGRGVLNQINDIFA